MADLYLYRSTNMDGETWAVEPNSLTKLRGCGLYVDSVRRVFLGRPTGEAEAFVEFDQVLPSVVALLVGVSYTPLAPYFDHVVVCDPVTNREVFRLPLSSEVLTVGGALDRGLKED